MRWVKKVKETESPKIGAYKIKRVFLIFPYTLLTRFDTQQTRWLEMTCVLYKYEEGFDGGRYWSPIRWMD